jgi:hypothetical protein
MAIEFFRVTRNRVLTYSTAVGETPTTLNLYYRHMSDNKVTSSKKKSGQGRITRKQIPKSNTWEFKPKLQNEAVVLHAILDIYSIPFYNEIVNDIRNLLTSLVQNHGFTDGSNRYNIIKNYTIQLIEGRNPTNPPWVSTSETYCIPSKLGINFIQLIIGCIENSDAALRSKYYQTIITILNISRMVEGLTTPEFNSVIEKASTIDEELLREFETYVQIQLNTDKYDQPMVNLFEYRFNLMKSGPNSKPKIESATEEAIALLKGKLHKPFLALCQEMDVNYLYDYLVELVKAHPVTDQQSETRDEKTYLRKLVSVPDSGFKTRIVAIVDFWSQLVLEPVRDHLQLTIERKFSKTDFRKSHDGGVNAMVEFQKRCIAQETINNHTLDVKHLKFYDISSWTDRFHRDLQKITMKYLFNPRLAEAWAQLVVHCEWYSPDLKRTVKYGQGQGMGTNGSFDAATLTDHLFINFLIDKKTSLSGIFSNNECYGKVGDDLWIYDPEGVILEYYEKINLPINLSKSKEYCELGSVAEFCSRTFINGDDASRISPNVISRSKNYRYIPTLLSLCASRGIQLDATSFSSLSNNVKGTSETYLDKLQDWLIGMLVIGQYEQSSQFNNLSLDYLEAGGWITSDRLRGILADQKLMNRVMIAHSIVSIAESKENIEDLIFDIVEAMEPDFDDIISLSDRDTNLFDMKDPHAEIALRFCGDGTVLTPKQIIVFGRFADQRRLVRDELFEADELTWNMDEPGDILKYARALERIASRSCYDQGNINYTPKRVYQTQFAIVKILSRLNDDFTVLRLDDSQQIRSVLMEIQYDRISSEWEMDLPTLDVVP